MAFEPEYPTAEDWLRDPAGSWGRLWQIFNYKLDAYTAGTKQIPLLEGKLAGYDLAIQRLTNGVARDNLAAMLQKFRSALDKLKSDRATLEGQVVNGLAQLRAEGQRLNQPAAGLGLAPIVGAALIGAIALVGYGITVWLNSLANVAAQEKSVGNSILAYARQAGLNAEQTQSLLHEANQTPTPRVPGDIFGQLADLLPWAVGLAALIYFGPVVGRMLKPGRARA